MDGYAVKIDELGRLIEDLGTAADRMADANRKLAGGGAFGSLGNAELGKAGVDFEEAWGFGIGRLGDAAKEVTERLKTARERYQRIEQEFGAELGKIAPDPPISRPAGGWKFELPSDKGVVGGGITGGIKDVLGGDR